MPKSRAKVAPATVIHGIQKIKSQATKLAPVVASSPPAEQPEDDSDSAGTSQDEGDDGDDDAVPLDEVEFIDDDAVPQQKLEIDNKVRKQFFFWLIRSAFTFHGHRSPSNTSVKLSNSTPRYPGPKPLRLHIPKNSTWMSTTTSTVNLRCRHHFLFFPPPIILSDPHCLFVATNRPFIVPKQPALSPPNTLSLSLAPRTILLKWSNPMHTWNGSVNDCWMKVQPSKKARKRERKGKGRSLGSRYNLRN